jgi:hypothetical protein
MKHTEIAIEEQLRLSVLSKKLDMGYSSLIRLLDGLKIPVFGERSNKYIDSKYLDRLLLEDNERWCWKCGAVKHSGQFSRYKNICTECYSNQFRVDNTKRKSNPNKKEEDRLRYLKNKDEYKRRRQKPEFKEKMAHTKRYQRYGLTEDQYNRMVESHANQCGICRRSDKKLFVDHNHGTNKVRGLICDNCNRGIGHMQDSITILQMAIDYLAKYDLQ